MKQKVTLDLAKKQGPPKKRSLNRRIIGWISPYLIYFFSKYSIHPNVISFSWIILAFIGFYFIALGSYTHMVIGILIYHFALLLDSTDGGVARILGKTNAGGEFLDRFFSTINRSVLLFAMGIGLFRVRGELLFLYLGIWSALFIFLDNFVRLKNYEALANSGRLDLIKDNVKKIKSAKRGIKFYIIELFRPGNHFTLSFFAIIFALVDIYLYLFSIIIFLQFLYSFLNIFIDLKHTNQKG
jgi:phosphatidylglycerophosphate synthase